VEPGETPTFEKPTDVESGPVDSQGLWPKPLPSPWGRFVRRVKQSWLAHELGVRRPHAIGRFQGIRMLGKGGCGIVMLARDPKLGRDVAIKLGQQPRADEMLREAQLLARLSHPNIVKVYETGTHEGNPFFVMEHVVGVNGARFIGEAADWRSVLRVYIAAGRGLAAAHRQGVIHGDIKPANLLIGDDGHVQVSDFGKGQVIADGLRVQGGTPQYMAPEVRLTNPATPRSDQWSFCVALWETLEGVRPFPDSELEDWLKAVYHREFVTAGQLQRLMTQDLRSILEIGLAFAPGDRFSSMDALVYELDTLLSGELPDPADAAGLGPPFNRAGSRPSSWWWRCARRVPSAGRRSATGWGSCPREYSQMIRSRARSPPQTKATAKQRSPNSTVSRR